MFFRRLLASPIIVASAAFAVGSGPVHAAPASSLIQAAPNLRAIEDPALATPGIEKAYYYYYRRHYYRPYYRRHYYRHYRRHYYHYYRPRYYRHYYHRYYRPFYY